MRTFTKKSVIVISFVCMIAFISSGCQVFQKLAVSMQVRNYVNVLKEENVDKLMSMLSDSYIQDILEARSRKEYYNPITERYEKVEYTREDLKKDLQKRFDDYFQVTGMDLSYLEIVVEGEYAQASNIYIKGIFGKESEDRIISESLSLRKEGNKWMITGCGFVGYSYYY